jgi:hypothetical protein
VRVSDFDGPHTGRAWARRIRRTGVWFGPAPPLPRGERLLAPPTGAECPAIRSSEPQGGATGTGRTPRPPTRG